MSNKLQQMYGSHGLFIQNDRLAIPEMPQLGEIQANYPGLTATLVGKIYGDEVSNHIKEVRRTKSIHIEMFGLIMQCVSPESADRIRMRPAFINARSSDDP